VENPSEETFCRPDQKTGKKVTCQRTLSMSNSDWKSTQFATFPVTI